VPLADSRKLCSLKAVPRGEWPRVGSKGGLIFAQMTARGDYPEKMRICRLSRPVWPGLAEVCYTAPTLPN
jgi:hypothetical protein